MSPRKKIIGALYVFSVLAQNYLSQISALSNEQVAHFTAHDWVRCIMNLLLASAITWKAYLADSGDRPEPPPGGAA